MTVFFRLTRIAPDAKAEALHQAIASTTSTTSSSDVFAFDSRDLAALPGAPFAYWLPSKLRSKIRASAPFAQNERTALQGLITGDDARFVRLWWEVATAEPDEGERKWVPFTKGGKRAHLYADVSTMVRYDDVGQVGIQQVGRYGRGATHYYRPGMSWPLRGTRFSAYAVPAGCIFSVGGKMAFAPTNQLLASLGLFNGAAFDAFLMVRAGKVGGVQYEAGLLQQAPVPDLDSPASSGLGLLAKEGWHLRYQLDSITEGSHAFVFPLALRRRSDAFNYDEIERAARAIDAKIDAESFAAYGLEDVEKKALEGSAEQLAATDSSAESGEDESDEDEPGEQQSLLTASWLVGVAFGRFDPRLATGERAIPPEPEPFDPLPSRSPGMYPEGEGPAERHDILVDDEGHADDLAARATAVAGRVKVEVPENLRAWLAKDCFPLHIKMYSKSRRKAPIYWQLATPSASYSVWLYIHAFSKDTLFRVQNDYAAPKLAHEERRLESLTSELRDGATAAQRKTLAAQEAVVDELRAFLDEVKRVAPLWNPNLDDGVVINFAPLWRLVPQNKSWQKELKSTWDALCDGKYDWGHLAMHLWPERVVPKCAKDRSLAIAHGLEDVFWVEGTDGKWTARKTPARSVDELVRERTSPAVKAALKSLLEAPVAQGGSGRGRGRGGRSRAAATADEGGSR